MPVQPGGATDTVARMEKIVARNIINFIEAFNQAIQDLRSRNTITDLTRMVEQGDFGEFFVSLDEVSKVFATQYAAAFSLSAQDTSEFLNRVLTNTVAYDQSGLRIAQILAENQFRLISNFSQSQRELLAQILTRSIIQGLNPRQAALNFRQSIGLTPRQELAVVRYREALSNNSLSALNNTLRDKRSDRKVRRAVNSGTPLSDDEINRMATRYKDRLIRYRAETIARTEALRATHMGAEEMYTQMFENGFLRPEQVEQSWIAAQDERTRGTHSFLHQQIRPVGEPWETVNGFIRFPGDPQAPASETVNCRCIITRRIMP